MRITNDPEDPAFRHALMLGLNTESVDVMLNGMRLNDLYPICSADEERGEVGVYLKNPDGPGVVTDFRTGKPYVLTLTGVVKIIPSAVTGTAIWPHPGLFQFPVSKEQAMKVMM